MVKKLFKKWVEVVKEHPNLIKGLSGKRRPVKYEPRVIWDALASEGRQDVLEKLYHVEKKTPGFGTIAIPLSGFSCNKDTHEAVCLWLKEQGVNLVNPPREYEELKNTLKKL